MTHLIEKIIADQPRFHAWPDGRSANWAVAPDVLRFIFRQLTPDMATLETGAGQTTAAFCIAGTRHVAITPDTEQAEKIRDYLAGLGVACDLTFIPESSDSALPAGRGLPDQLDFVLIDGAHRFPFPILDWYYTQARIPVGGMVAVDDHAMPSVRILYDFLRGEDDWELVKEFPVTAIFRRVQKTEPVLDWVGQNINKPHLDRVTEGVAIDPEPLKKPGDSQPVAAEERKLEVELRAAKLQLKNLTSELREREGRLRRSEANLRTVESTLKSTENNLRRTRDELWQIKNSRAYRLYRQLRAAATLPKRALRRLWPKG